MAIGATPHARTQIVLIMFNCDFYTRFLFFAVRLFCCYCCCCSCYQRLDFLLLSAVVCQF